MGASRPKTLRELREASGLSILELVRRTGIDQDSLRLWEMGQRQIDLAKLDRLSNVYNVSIDQIQLEPYRRHYANQGYNIVLHSHGHARSGYVARVGLFDPRAVPKASNVLAKISGLEGKGETQDVALDSLEQQLDEYFASRIQAVDDIANGPQGDPH